MFRLLRTGRHICRDDGTDYRDLERNEEQYSTLFRALGYRLIHHSQGFYYFEGANYLSTLRLQAISLFTLILFQDLEDKKFQEPERAWERNLLAKVFRVSELPHFETAKRRSMLLAVNVTPETLHEKVFKPMIRFGMLEMIGADQFNFRAPIYRFVELCMRIGQQEADTGDSKPAAADPAPQGQLPVIDQPVDAAQAPEVG